MTRMRLKINYDSFPAAEHLPSEIAALTKEHAKLAARLQDASAKLVDHIIHSGEHQAALKADEDARATAARKGEPAPASVHTVAYQARANELYREQSALSAGLNAIQLELEQALATQIDEVVQHADRFEDAQAAKLERAIGALSRALDGYQVSLGLASWARLTKEALQNPGTTPAAMIYEPDVPDPLRIGFVQVNVPDVMEAMKAMPLSHIHRRRAIAAAASVEEGYRAAGRRARESEHDIRKRALDEATSSGAEVAIS